MVTLTRSYKKVRNYQQTLLSSRRTLHGPHHLNFQASHYYVTWPLTAIVC